MNFTRCARCKRRFIFSSPLFSRFGPVHVRCLDELLWEETRQKLQRLKERVCEVVRIRNANGQSVDIFELIAQEIRNGALNGEWFLPGKIPQ